MSSKAQQNVTRGDWKCPKCGGLLQASLTIYLKDVAVNGDGRVLSFSTDHHAEYAKTYDFLKEVVNNAEGDELRVYCENDHEYKGRI